VCAFKKGNEVKHMMCLKMAQYKVSTRAENKREKEVKGKHPHYKLSVES